MTIREKITAALLQFGKKDLYDAGLNLFDVLGYNTSRTERLEDNSFKGFADMFIQDRAGFNADKALINEWQQVEFLFQLSEAEMSSQVDMFDTKEFNGSIIESYAFFAIDLKAETYTRSQLAQITREFNKLFDMPAMLVFKHGSTLTLSVINRRLHKRDKSKDVLEKVTLIKDIRLTDPHRAHVEILVDLSFEELHRKYSFSNFVALHESWTKCLDSKELSKRFYQELANWYFWAMDKVSFPDDIEKDPDVRNATNLIRLITRIIFVWFIKEKSLVPDALFNRSYLSKVLKDFNKNTKSHSYYQAILQNLFFGTLNQKMKERAFAKDAGYPANKNEYGVKNLFRYEDKFTLNETEVLAIFADIPFLNGGLFDCLDKEDENKKVIYVDGFSRETKKQAVLPDYLFFHEDQEVDLNEIYGTRNKRYRVKGLIDLLESYKFTITENTPLEEEIALDPELLGKVFENLLASYNPETQTTARKQTGSFYTPREIVNYMVDESLLAYLKQKLEENKYLDCEDELRQLLSYSEEPHCFDEKQTDLLIKAIDDCKILDPACGSGAFPMGMLHKLVHVLHKLDPENMKWKEQQIVKVENYIKDAETFPDAGIREKVIHDLQQTLQDIEESFNTDNNELDYGRKLYLIENCIYGVDIQPIAVQIAKLRFFISLIIDQKKQSSKENLGIRSLPNLETKFVAANTLIGLEKPAGQGLLRNLEIVKLENELKELRHQYFNARSRKEKLQFQKRDKKLRQEIARCLVDDGWDNSVAQQIVGFNPYDQNSSSPFFDPEWMFGVTNGFDIVIGNPPYGAYFTDDIKSYLFREYPLLKGQPESYEYFMYLAIAELTNSHGILSYIVPTNFIESKRAEGLRSLILNAGQIVVISNFRFNVWNNNSAETLVFIYNKDVIGKTKVLHPKNMDEFINGEEISLLDQKGWLSTPGKRFIIRSSGTLIEKINSNSVPLGLITEVSQGIIVYKTRQESQENKYIKSECPKSGNWVKLLDSKSHIEKYKVHWGGNYLNYGKWLWCPRDEKFFNSAKIVFIRLRNKSLAKKLIGFYDENNFYNRDNFNNIIAKNPSYSLKYILALFNSELINYWYKSHFDNVNINPEQVRMIPINKLQPKGQILFITIVEMIQLLKEEYSEGSAGIDFFEILIDYMVYELYLAEEVSSAGANLLCYLDELLNIRPIIEKGETEKALKTIEKVYREFSAPDHPVSIAIARMQEIEEVQIIEGRK